MGACAQRPRRRRYDVEDDVLVRDRSGSCRVDGGPRVRAQRRGNVRRADPDQREELDRGDRAHDDRGGAPGEGAGKMLCVVHGPNRFVGPAAVPATP
jgi:hypothetical protein